MSIRTFDDLASALGEDRTSAERVELHPVECHRLGRGQSEKECKRFRSFTPIPYVGKGIRVLVDPTCPIGDVKIFGHDGKWIDTISLNESRET